MGVDSAERSRQTYQSPTKFTTWEDYRSPGTGYAKVTGLKELYAAMQSLPAKLEANVMRGALRAGSKVFERIAKRNYLSYGHTEIAADVHVNTRLKQGRATADTSVGGKKKHFQVAWLEWGTASHYTGTGKTVGHKYHIAPKKKTALKFFWGAQQRWVVTKVGVWHPGIEPQRFLTRAYDEGTAEAVTATADYVRKRLNKMDVPYSEAGDV